MLTVCKALKLSFFFFFSQEAPSLKDEVSVAFLS